MAQSTASPAFFFLFSRSTKPSPVAVAAASSSPFSRSSLPLPSLQSSKARRRDGGGDAFASWGSYRKLEEEIFEFMRRSKKPGTFPTRDELIEAGRRDLAEAVATQGGYLAFGWDLVKEPQKEKENSDSNSGFVESTRDRGHGGHPDYPEVSISGRSMEEEEERSDDSVLEGILKRIEKQRSLAKDRKEINRASDNKRALDPGDGAFLNGKRPIEVNKTSNDALHDYRIVGSKNGRSSIISNGSVNSSTSDKWTPRLSLSNENSSSNNSIEAGGSVLLTEERTTTLEPPNSEKKDGLNGGGTLNNNSVGPSGSGRSEKEISLETKDIRLRLQQLESGLNSALHSVMSKVKKAMSHELDKSSAAKLNNLSDGWEFRETEIINAKDEVRSLRARLSVLEGKTALQIIEAHKLMEENQKRLDEARRVLSGLRNVSVMWPNPASEVLLVGSFDGWTTKRSMERSGEGVFSLNLMLYPGQYEIKFIVDGVWTIDPLRPVVNYSGHENNLLTVV